MEKFFVLYRNNTVHSKASCDESNTQGILELESIGYTLVTEEVYKAAELPTKESYITLEELQQENKMLKAQLKAQTERSDFIEDCIAEMATQVYGGV